MISNYVRYYFSYFENIEIWSTIIFCGVVLGGFIGLILSIGEGDIFPLIGGAIVGGIAGLIIAIIVFLSLGIVLGAATGLMVGAIKGNIKNYIIGGAIIGAIIFAIGWGLKNEFIASLLFIPMITAIGYIVGKSICE